MRTASAVILTNGLFMTEITERYPYFDAARLYRRRR